MNSNWVLIGIKLLEIEYENGKNKHKNTNKKHDQLDNGKNNKKQCESRFFATKKLIKKWINKLNESIEWTTTNHINIKHSIETLKMMMFMCFEYKINLNFYIK